MQGAWPLPPFFTIGGFAPDLPDVKTSQKTPKTLKLLNMCLRLLTHDPVLNDPMAAIFCYNYLSWSRAARTWWNKQNCSHWVSEVRARELRKLDAMSSPVQHEWIDLDRTHYKNESRVDVRGNAKRLVLDCQLSSWTNALLESACDCCEPAVLRFASVSGSLLSSGWASLLCPSDVLVCPFRELVGSAVEELDSATFTCPICALDSRQTSSSFFATRQLLIFLCQDTQQA